MTATAVVWCFAASLGLTNHGGRLNDWVTVRGPLYREKEMDFVPNFCSP
jgi:hypothetical protein